MSGSFTAAQPSWLSRRGLWLLTQLMIASEFFRRKVRILGETENYLTWLQTTFGEPKLKKSREEVWDLMIGAMSGGEWCVYEFGVAWGYTTKYWISRGIPQLKVWHAFDRFTGLPRGWRDLGVGAFDANGKTPAITDRRVEWHVGDVEDTLPIVQAPYPHKCIIFDLDLYEPTLFAWNSLKNKLIPGDLLYFDESYDMDERKVIDESILSSFRFEIIGSTTYALGMKYLGPKI